MTSTLLSAAESGHHAPPEVSLPMTLAFASILVAMIVCLALEEKLHAKKSLITGLFAVIALLAGAAAGILPKGPVLRHAKALGCDTITHTQQSGARSARAAHGAVVVRAVHPRHAEIRWVPRHRVHRGRATAREGSRVVRRAVRLGKVIPRGLWIITVVVESVLPAAILLIIIDFSVLSPYLMLLSPFILVYFLLTILSTLHLDPLLSRLSGIIGGVSYIALLLHVQRV